MDNKLCIFSYNSRGFSLDKQVFCRNLIMSSGCKLTVLCNQENFLLKANGYIIKQALPDFHILFKPALKECIEGRPRNGMFIAMPKTITENVTDISPDHWRVQAALIQNKNSNIMIVNSFFPQDSKSLIHIDPELEEVMAVINNLLTNYHFDDVIWMSDINADFNRNPKYVSRLIDDININKSWDSFPIDYTHEFENNNNKTYICTIDHFFWNENLKKKVKDAGVLHPPENTSDHCPIYCTVDYDCLDNQIQSKNLTTAAKVNWKSVTPHQKNALNKTS